MSKIFLFLILTVIVEGQKTDREILLENVKSLDAKGMTVGPLILYQHPKTFSIFTGQADDIQRPIVSAGFDENSRYFAYGHTGYLQYFSNSTDTNQLLLNAIKWTSKKEDLFQINVAVYKSSTLLSNFLTILQIPHKVINEFDLKNYEFMDQFDILCITFNPQIVQNIVQDINGYLDRGGKGIIGASTGWSYGNPSLSLRDFYHGGNEIFSKIGINWRWGYIWTQNGQTWFNTSNDSIYTNFYASAEYFVQNFNGISTPPVENAMDCIHYDLDSVPRVELETNVIYDELTEIVIQMQKIPSESTGVSDRIEQKFLSLFSSLMVSLPLHKIVVHPATVNFPGDFEVKNDGKSAQLTSPHKIMISKYKSSEKTTSHFYGKIYFDDKNFEKSTEMNVELIPNTWYSTGVYAKSGEEIQIEVLEGFEHLKKISIQIGSHSDNLARSHLETWYRHPTILMKQIFKENPQKFKSSFGGLVYISTVYNSEFSIKLSITGGYKAPYYVHGVTSVDDWNNEIKLRSAPWTEFSSDKFIITSPTKIASKISNPDQLMSFWGVVLDSMADLISLPRNRDRPERIVSDVQISAGYMHSGYPIMTHLDMADYIISYEHLSKYGDWGLFHELGHNHQNQMWTFEGTGEVTCNLFAMYIFNTILNISTDLAHPEMSKQKMKKNLQNYISQGVNFELWKSQPFTALLTYYHLERVFGWTVYKEVFNSYNQLTPDQKPSTNQDKIDKWCEIFSKITNENLIEFFKSWGFTISPRVDDDLASLPLSDLRIGDLNQIIN